MDNYSVLMSVYFQEKAEYLRQAMESMRKQTVPTDDFVLVCDGPLTVELNAVVEEMEDKYPGKLQIIKLEKNVGLGNALNEGLKHCKNELVARMDSDDISRPDRCEKQLKAFSLHPEISICSGTILEFKEHNKHVVGKRELPETNAEIRHFSRKRNPFNHPAVMFKKTAVQAVGSYNEDYHLFEDYHLWVRMLKNGARGYNIKEPVLYMRTSENSFLRRGGYSYILSMLKFHRYIYSIGWSSQMDYLLGAIPHAAVCMLPNRLREKIYGILHGEGRR